MVHPGGPAITAPAPGPGDRARMLLDAVPGVDTHPGSEGLVIVVAVMEHEWMSHREEFISWVDTALRDAEVAIHNGDASLRRSLWSRNEPVSVLGAWRNAHGQAELDELFAHLAESFSDCTSYEFELLEAEVLGDVAYTVGLEHTAASIDGVPSSYTLRATQIYRREGGEWMVAHRHGSAPPA